MSILFLRKWATFLLSFCGIIPIFSVITHAQPLHQSQCPVWVPTQGKPTAVAMVVHGINLDPNKMASISNFLENKGVEVLVTKLFGDESLGDMQMVTTSAWRRDMARDYGCAKSRANSLEVPLVYVGYSLGGILLIDFLSLKQLPQAFDKTVLLTPALALNSYIYLASGLTVFADWVLTPAFTPLDYALYPVMPVAAYRAMFNMVEKFTKKFSPQANVPTLVIIDRHDEITDFSGLVNLIDRNNLTNWRIMTVDNRGSTLAIPAHHLIIDQASLGPKEWYRMLDQIDSFLGLERRERQTR